MVDLVIPVAKTILRPMKEIETKDSFYNQMIDEEHWAIFNIAFTPYPELIEIEDLMLY